MAGLQKEIWLDILMENFYPNDSFLSKSRDMSSFVEYNKLNLAEIGVDPNVLVDNTSYPIPISQRSDVPLELPLSTLDTENTLVRNVEEMESAYDKMASVVRQHQNSLRSKAAQLAAYNWAPSKQDAFNAVLAATGANGALSFSDIIKLAGFYDDMDAPKEGRVLVLCPKHRRDLMAEDMKLYKMIFTDGTLYDFQIFSFSKNPTYTSAGVRNAFGAAGNIASIAYHRDEVMRADGTVDMFSKLRDPEQRGDIVGFQKRFAALSIRKKHSGAIYSE